MPEPWAKNVGMKFPNDLTDLISLVILVIALGFVGLLLWTYFSSAAS